MPGGKSKCTRSATGVLRIGTNAILQNNSNNVSQRNMHSSEHCCLELDVIRGTIEKRFQNLWKQFEKELADMKEKVRELEDEVWELKKIKLDVEEYKQETTNLRNEYRKLQFHHLVRSSNSYLPYLSQKTETQNTRCGRQRGIQKNVL